MVADVGGETVVFGRRNDDEGGVAEHLEREADVGCATPTVESDDRRPDPQQCVVGDDGVDRVPRHEHDAGVGADTTLGQLRNGAVHPRHQLRVAELVVVVGDGERVRFPLGTGFEAVGEAAVVPPALGAVLRRQGIGNPRRDGERGQRRLVYRFSRVRSNAAPRPSKRLVPHGLPCR